MTNLLTILVVLISLLLIGAILVQNPKGGGVDSTFGGAATNQMLGAARSADFIEKATWYLAAALLILCIASSLVVGTGSEVNLLSE
jgi:preprotein translocase subunit SecG